MRGMRFGASFDARDDCGAGASPSGAIVACAQKPSARRTSARLTPDGMHGQPSRRGPFYCIPVGRADSPGKRVPLALRLQSSTLRLRTVAAARATSGIATRGRLFGMTRTVAARAGCAATIRRCSRICGQHALSGCTRAGARTHVKAWRRRRELTSQLFPLAFGRGTMRERQCGPARRRRRKATTALTRSGSGVALAEMARGAQGYDGASHRA